MRIGLYCLSFLFIISGVCAAYLYVRKPFSQSFVEVKNKYQASDILVLDRNELPLKHIRVRNQQRSLAWTPWAQISPSFQRLLVQTEDKRFYQHRGVDALALLHSIWQSSFYSGRRGGSTITMQLVKLLHTKSPHKGIIKNLQQKLQQILQAREIERTWSKSEILEAYINQTAFRGEIVGIAAASYGYFDKSPAALSEVEAGILIALLRAPNATVTMIARRLCLILPKNDCKELQKIVDSLFASDYHIARSMDHLPVLSKFLFAENQIPSSPQNMKTSLDLRIQDFALQILREQLNELKNKNVHEGAVLVLDTKTGKPLAYVGNPGDHFTSFSQIDGIQARRQVGSTIKAFIYAKAFDLNILNLNSLIEDSRADIRVAGGSVYHPKNYDRIFRGFVGAGEALASSLNVPAVRTLALVGERRVVETLKNLGFTDLQDENYYGPSLALGSLDASLWEMTQAYRQISQSNVFSKSARDQVFQSLALPEYRRLTFGIDNVLTLPFLAAVKTGTSKDMRDNWCIGWTSEYTVGVWVGNFNGQAMWNVSGVTGAAPIWRKLMLALHPNPPPLSLSLRYQAPAPFIKRRSISRIRYPVEDMRIGFDPDIPIRLQKISIEIDNPQKGQHIYINGKELGSTRESILWPLKKGRQRLALKTIHGKIVDQVQFEVR